MLNSYETLKKRTALIESGDYSDRMFDYAKQFASADTIVIAAPYWDLSFPALLKTYFENIYDDRWSPLEKKTTKLHITLEKKIDSWADYAREIIWFGKRRSATLCTNSREKTEVYYSD